jgi:hypothetical protein
LHKPFDPLPFARGKAGISTGRGSFTWRPEGEPGMKRSGICPPKTDGKEPFFDRDLAKIFEWRFILRIETIFKTLSQYNVKLGEEEIKLLIMELLNNVGLAGIREEIERYKTKTKNRRYGYKEDIERARMGDNASLFRLVEWDKGWLFVDWVKNKILEAQDNWDNDFLQKMGEALSAEPRIRKPIDANDKEERRLILKTMEAFIPYYTTHNPEVPKSKIVNKVIKAFFEGFNEKWDHWLREDAKDEHISKDLDYFRQYIKRHLNTG